MRDVNRRLVAPADRVRALADASKFGLSALCRVRSTDRINGLSTGSCAESHWRADLDKAKEQRTAV